MLNLEDVIAIINEHVADEESKAEIGVKLLEKDIPSDNSELESLRAELEAERSGRAADKASYVERINKFIYGGDPGPEDPGDPGEPETNDEEAVETKSFYERYMED